MKKMVNCSSCGAEFEARLVRCPFCGTHYEPAAEEEYMGKLEGVREELESHKGDAAQSTSKALIKTVILFVLAVAVILALAIGIFSLPEMRSRERQQEKKAEVLQRYGVSTEEPSASDGK